MQCFYLKFGKLSLHSNRISYWGCEYVIVFIGTQDRAGGPTHAILNVKVAVWWYFTWRKTRRNRCHFIVGLPGAVTLAATWSDTAVYKVKSRDKTSVVETTKRRLVTVVTVGSVYTLNLLITLNMKPAWWCPIWVPKAVWSPQRSLTLLKHLWLSHSDFDVICGARCSIANAKDDVSESSLSFGDWVRCDFSVLRVRERVG